MTKITLSPFGHMREFITDKIDIQLENPTSFGLRQYLSGKFPEAGDIITLCAFSDDTRIFADDEPFCDGAHISILPPVCGG